MDFPIVFTLIAITFGAVIVFASRSKRETQDRLEQKDKPKSALAADRDSRGEPADV